MRTARLLPAVLVVALWADPAQAFGRRKARPANCPPVVVYHPPAPCYLSPVPAVLPPPVVVQPAPAAMTVPPPPPAPTAAPPPAAPPAAVAPAAVPPPVAAAPAGVQPQFDYDAQPGGRPAYYYTYDSSGKLIVQQWMDWVFRGGRDAGVPRPPLPVVGWFIGR